MNVDRTTVGMNFEYRPNEDVLVRGGWSESFRAPDMQQAFIDETQGFASGIDYYQCWLVTGSVINCGAQGFDVINIETTLEVTQILKMNQDTHPLLVLYGHQSKDSQ